MTLHDQIRHDLSRLVEVLDVLDAAVQADAGELPVAQLCRLMVDLEGAVEDFAHYAELLTGQQRKRARPG
jgi:hypothetical protein